jgi:3-oxoacyl-[acyl-carrier protein] reductase
MTVKPLAGRAAIVTGASRGIGRATALRMAQEGAGVVVNYARDAARADEAVAAIKATGGTAIAVQADITRLPDIARLFDAAEDRFGKVDILVNNAGVGGRGSVLSATEADYDRLFAITKGVFFTLQAAATRLADNGRIISISTGLTRNWALNSGAYAGSKAAIEQFSRSLSKDLGRRGITVNMVLPGVIETEMTSGMTPEFKSHAAQQTSFGRLGRPEDIGDVIAFLAGDDARWITGQLIVVNGGSTP